MFVAISGNRWSDHPRLGMGECLYSDSFDSLMTDLLEMYCDNMSSEDYDIADVFEDWQILVYETGPEPLKVNIIPRVAAKAVILPT